MPWIQYALQPVLLRRTKTSKIDGEPVVILPPRQQQLIRKSFSASEQKFYDQVQQESMQKLKVSEFSIACHIFGFAFCSQGNTVPAHT